MIRGKLKTIVAIMIIAFIVPSLVPVSYSFGVSKISSMISIDICNETDTFTTPAFDLPAINEWWCSFCKPCLSGSSIVESPILRDFIISFKEKEPPEPSYNILS